VFVTHFRHYPSLYLKELMKIMENLPMGFVFGLKFRLGISEIPNRNDFH